MNVWLPFVVGGSGTDTFTRSFASTIESLGHTAHPQPFSHTSHLMPDLLRGVNPPRGADVTLTNSVNGFAFARADIPMVTMVQLCVHDPEFAPFRSLHQSVYQRSLVRWFEGRTFEAAGRVVAVSEATRRSVRAAFPGVDPLVILNGADVDFFVPATDRQRLVDRPFELLFVGNLTRRKGADLLPAIMRALGPRFHLRYTSGLRQAGALEVDNATGLGRLDRSGVRRAMQRADAFLFPTRLEGLPLSVLEAMACGLPVVGSNRSSMPEAVEHGVTGLLSDLEPTTLAQNVEALSEQPDLRNDMAVAARTRVVDLFGIERTAKRYLQLFGEIAPG